MTNSNVLKENYGSIKEKIKSGLKKYKPALKPIFKLYAYLFSIFNNANFGELLLEAYIRGKPIRVWEPNFPWLPLELLAVVGSDIVLAYCIYEDVYKPIGRGIHKNRS